MGGLSGIVVFPLDFEPSFDSFKASGIVGEVAAWRFPRREL
jgi:hypothetical protein